MKRATARLMCGSALSALLIQLAHANPAGGVVAQGQAAISSAGSTLTVDQKTKIVIVNWQSFNIGQNETTRFNQPSASATAVNRIGGADPAQILGKLSANGRIILIDSSGILFGPGAKVNAGALIAITSDAADADLMAGKATFDKPGNPNARIVNQGSITTAQSGMVGLIAPSVSNQGLIQARLGSVNLAGSNVFTLDFTGDGLISFPLDPNVVVAALDSHGKPVKALVANMGKIEGATVTLTARAAAGLVENAISMRGKVVATAAHEVGGKIVLDAGQGNIQLAGATLDASGAKGGGSVTVGGWNTASVSADAATTIKANAATSGDGGQISVISQTTAFHGSIQARGGAKSGNGGTIETSGAALNVSDAKVSAAAPKGTAGTWLLDPTDLIIDQTLATTLDSALNGGTSVVLATSASGAPTGATLTAGEINAGGNGDILVNAPLAWTSAAGLTLNAYNNIAVNAAVTFGGAVGASLTLNAGNALNIAAPIKVNGAGAVSLAYNTSAPTNLSFGMTTAGAFAGGIAYANADGSAATSAVSGQSLSVNGAPYTLLYNMADVAGINTAPGGAFALATNIDASASIANPYTGAVIGSFSGTFEGLGNTISNLTIHALAPTSYGPLGPDEIGLFKGNSGTLRDFALSGGGVTADSFNGLYNLGFDNQIASGNYNPGTAELAGAVVGKNSGAIVNVASSAAVTGDVAVGGLVGVNTGTILNSMASGAVTVGTSYEYEGYETGGLVGLNYTGTISGSWATGAVSGYNMVGGLIGADINGTTASAYATGAVTGTADVGGLIGNLGGGSLQSSYATGAVNGVIYSYNRPTYSCAFNNVCTLTGDYVTDHTPSSNVGGLIGEIYDNYYYSSSVYQATTISSAYATGSVTAANGSFVGGLIGFMNIYLPYGVYGAQGTTLTGVYATGAVSGSQSVGGLAGQLAFATLNNAYATGAVSGNQAVGGLVGQVVSATLNNATASGAVTGTGTGVAAIGGLVGDFNYAYGAGYSGATGGTNLSATGAVSAPDGANYVGGLVGLFGTAGALSNASATGTVTVGANGGNVGGLIGADGISGYTMIGGLYVGSGLANGSGGASVDASSASGAVKAGSSATAVGGLIGSANNAGSTFDVGNSYATGSVTVGDNAARIGGLIGDDQLPGFDGGVGYGYGATPIHSDFATGAVTAGANATLVGGLIGNVNTMEMDFVSATGAVTVGPNSNGVGGLAGGLDPGFNFNYGCCIAYAGYSTGQVSAGGGSQNVDASIGANYASQFYSGNNYGGSEGIYIYYNSDTAGVTSAVSHPATTAQFMDGTVVNAVNSQGYLGYIFSGGTNGLYPYQPQIFPNGVQAISGTTYNANGTAATGASVALAGLGPLGQTSTGANGAYYITLPAGTLGATALETAATLNAATVVPIGVSGSVSGANLYANTLSTVTSATLASAAPAQAATRTLALAAAGTDAGALAALTGATGYGLVATGSSFTIDQGLTASGGFVAATAAAGAPLTVAAPVSATGSVLLQTSGDLTLAAGGSVSGASPVLAATGAFLNNAGASAVTASSGSWQVYSAAPAGDTFGGLDSGNTAIWNMSAGGTVTASGDRYVFAYTPAALTVATVNDSKTYGVDATSAVAADYTITGFQPGVAGAFLGDTAATAVSGAASVTSTGAGGSVSVGSYAYQIGLGTLASGVGYSFALQNSGALTVTARPLTVTADAKTQIYGAAVPSLTYSVGGLGLVNGDTLSGGLATTASAAAGVGAYGITQGSLAASGNYAVTYVSANDVIGTRAITVTADAKTQTYGDAVPTLSYNVGGLGLVNGDTLSGGLATTASATANVGTYAISLGTLTNSNYAISYTGANDVIGARGITVTADAKTQTYGDAVPTLSYNVGGLGLVNGDTLSGGLATTASATANVGAYAITQGTLANSNYAISYTGADDVIGVRAITVTADAKTQIYGNAVPSLTYSVGGLGLVNGDTLSGGLATTATSASTVGNYGITLGTLAASSNYAVTYTGADDVIGVRPIMVTADAKTQIYGNAVPALTYAVGGLGLVNGDTLSGGLATTVSATANVGAYGISQGSLAASSNYAVTYVSANDVIGARPLTVTADAKTQTYGNAVPALTYAVGGLGLVNGDTLSGGLATTASTTANAGAYAITQGTLAASSNYAISYVGANDVIGARGITVTADAKTQTYGNAVPTLTYSVGGLGLVNGDTLSGGLATTASATANVGAYAITQGTLANSNYAISYTGASDVIGARGITVTADAKTQTYGNAVPALTYAVGGFGLVNGDTLSGGLATTASTTTGVGTYAISQGTLAASSNYAVTYTGADDVIGARPLTVTADAKTQIYGNAVPSLTYSVGGLGLVNGDTLSGGLATTANTASNIGPYDITQGSLAASANYAISYTGAALTIEPAKTASLEVVPGYADTLLFGFGKQLDALWSQLDWRVSQTLWADLDSRVACMILGCAPQVSRGVSKATPSTLRIRISRR